MAGPKTFDRVKESTTTTGTGAVTLAGAASGYRAFSDVLSDTDTCLYAIAGTTEWEVGLGTFASGANTLTRTTVLASSNGGSAVNLSAGSKDIWIDHPAALLTYFNPTAAYASLAAYQQGRLGFSTDGFHLLRDTGSAFSPWGPIYPCTLPVDGDYAWVNQGSATVTASGGGIYLSAPATASLDIKIRKKAAPAAPYTITALLDPMLPGGGGLAGLLFRESGSGKLVIFGPYSDTTSPPVPGLLVGKSTSPTVYSADYLRQNMTMPRWLRIADDNSNRICSISMDGQNWYAFHTVGRTDFLTADEVGFCTISANASFPASASLLSWKEA